MNLGENIYKHRTEKNMSQGDFADALEVSRQSVSKWENNSAVPELDKLVKMAEIFEISLNELVTGAEYAPSAPPQSAEPEVRTVYVEKTAEPKVVFVEKPGAVNITVWTVLGAVLLLASIGLGLILSNEYSFSLTEVLLMMLPLAVCGVICIVSRQPLLFCYWVACGGYWLYFFMLSNRWEEMTLLLILGVVLVAGAVLYTVKLHKTGKIHVEAWIWAVMALVLCGAAVLLFINAMPPFWEQATPLRPVPLG